MITSIDSGVVVDRFFKHSHGCLSGMIKTKRSLFQSLSGQEERYANPNKMTHLKRRLWVSENEGQKQQQHFIDVKALLTSSVDILDRLSEFKGLIEENIRERGEDDWLTPELEQTIYAYLFSVHCLFNKETQEGQEHVVPEGVLDIHASLYSDGFLEKAEKLHSELNAQSSFISKHLAAFHTSLAGLAGVFVPIWGGV
jgi:hypothetical protein